MQPFSKPIVTQMVRLDDGTEVTHADLLGAAKGIHGRTVDNPMTVYEPAIAKLLVDRGAATLLDGNRYVSASEERRHALEEEIRNLHYD